MQFDNNIREYRGTEVVWRKIDLPSLIRGTGKVMKSGKYFAPTFFNVMEKDTEMV